MFPFALYSEGTHFTMAPLTDRQNQVWYLARTCGWPTSRIALQLGVSKRAVNSIKARIRARQRIGASRTAVVKCRFIRAGSFLGAWGT